MYEPGVLEVLTGLAVCGQDEMFPTEHELEMDAVATARAAVQPARVVELAKRHRLVAHGVKVLPELEDRSVGRDRTRTRLC